MFETKLVLQGMQLQVYCNASCTLRYLIWNAKYYLIVRYVKINVFVFDTLSFFTFGILGHLHI